MSTKREKRNDRGEHTPPPPLEGGRVLVAGQGLAGSFVSYFLQQSGVQVTLADPQKGDAASAVGAGLMTPLTGKRFAPNWRWPELSAFSKNVFASLEEEWGTPLIRMLDTVHFFSGPEEKDIWSHRKARNEVNQWVEEMDENACAVWPVVDPRQGGLLLRDSARVDLAATLAGFRKHFEARGMLVKAEVQPADLQVGAEGVSWQGETFDLVVFCDGYRAAQNSWLAPLAFRNAHGELLDVEIPGLPETHVLKQGVFLAPTGNGLFKVGATYSWNQSEPLPTKAGGAELEERLRQWMPLPYRICQHWAGIRPVALQRVPVLGCHPRHPRIAALNGLGSKGALYAPFFADQLCRYLLTGLPLDREVNLTRRIKRVKCD